MTRVVPKKPDDISEKKWRMVTDFRQLNEATVGNSDPLPITTDIMESIATAAFITALELWTGFWQVETHPDDIHKPASLGLTDIMNM